MTKLKLAAIPKRTLEIERPDGKIFTVTLRDVLVEELDNHHKKMRELDEKFAKGDILIWEFYQAIFSENLEDFNPDDFKGMSSEYLSQIANALKELRTQSPEEEKKSHG